jgi:nucleoside-diphosphate-sugar epimerase
MSRRLAITGATGFIGRHVSAHLLSRGDDVLAIVRPESKQQPPDGVRVVRTGLVTRGLTEAFDGVEAVVHLAGVVFTNRDADYAAVNTDGTRAVAEAALAVGARLIHVSSLAAAGPAPAAHPRSEDDPSAPVTPYGTSKLESEHAVAALTGLSWTILRPGVVYGPGDRAVLTLFQLAKWGLLPVVGRPEAAYTFIHVDDVVRSIDAALTAPSTGETIFVGHPHPVTARQLLEGIRSAVGRPALMLPIPLGLTWAAAEIGELIGAAIGRPLPLNRRRYVELASEGFVCRVDRLRDRLGIVAKIDLREGLAGTVVWYRRAGWL